MKHEVRPSTKILVFDRAGWRVIRREGMKKKIRTVTNMMAGWILDGQQIKGRKPRAEKA